MRISFILFLSIIVNYAWSQDIDYKIKNVENGLILPLTISPGQETPKGNILQKMRDHKVHGASVAVINNYEIISAKAYGVGEADGNVSVTTETLFQAASIGKVVTVVAALSLVKAGKVDLDEDVNLKLIRWKIVENENTEAKKVTLRHLLSHSAGLTDDYGFPGYDPTSEIPTLLQILQMERPANNKKALSINTIPGEIERYSGGGYLIVQLLIEDITGIPFSEYVKQVVFDRLQMNNTTYSHQPDKTMGSPIAAGHLSNGKRLRNKKYNVYPEMAAAGPWTTATDLAKLIIALQRTFKNDSAILNTELVREMMRPQINNKGLGVNLKGVERPEAFWHAGQNLGYIGLFFGLIDKGDGAVILLNSDGGETMMQEFITSVANEFLWPVMRTYNCRTITEDEAQSILGTYKSPKLSETLSITRGKVGVTVRASNSKQDYTLYKVDENHYTFKNSQDYFKLTFEFNDKQPTLFYSESMRKTIEFKRVE